MPTSSARRSPGPAPAKAARPRRSSSVTLAACRDRSPVRLFIAEKGADMHCRVGNLSLSNAVVYDWLAEVFGK